VKASMAAYAKKVMPELQAMKTADLVEPTPLDMPAHSKAA